MIATHLDLAGKTLLETAWESKDDSSQLEHAANPAKSQQAPI